MTGCASYTTVHTSPGESPLRNAADRRFVADLLEVARQVEHVSVAELVDAGAHQLVELGLAPGQDPLGRISTGTAAISAKRRASASDPTMAP